MPRGSAPGERRGGRQPGSPNKSTLARLALLDQALKEGMTPLEFMLDIVRKPYPEDADALTKVKLDELRLDAAKASAPYIHARPASMDRPVTLALTGESLAEQGRQVLDAIATGKLTPNQGATLMQAISAQARVVEVDELEKRVAVNSRANRARDSRRNRASAKCRFVVSNGWLF